MKRICLLLLILIPCVLPAQQPGYTKSTQTEKKGKREFIVHKVLKGQTLYAISKLYNIELDSIVYFNPEIKDGLKTGITIMLPLPVKPGTTVVTATEEKKNVREKKDTSQLMTETVKCDSAFHSGPFQVALMLPFYLSEIDSIPAEAVDETPGSTDFKSLRFIQFYEGALMAVDSLVKLGISVKLHVFDVDEDTNKIRRILREPPLKKMDLIIGLLYGNSFQKLSAFAKANQIPLVNPLSNKIMHIENNPYVFLANPTVGTMANQIAEFIALNYYDNIIILINSGKENEKKSMKIIYEGLIEDFKSKGKPTSNIYMFSGEGELNKIPPLISGTSRNALVILSNNELFVANAMRYIKEWSASHPVMVFGMPGWLDFRSIESKLLVDLNFHSFGTGFVDYHEPGTIRFIRQYRDIYKAEPSDLAFQGFDVSYYFLSCLMWYGKNFMGCTPLFKYKGMQTHFIMRKLDNSGFENSWLNIFRIQDYQVIDARK